MSNLAWGLQMAVLGMGLVFGLLVLLWALLRGVLWLDRPPAEPAPLPAPAASVAPAPVAPELLSAIVAATLLHRTHLRRQAVAAMRRHAPGSQLHASRWVGAGRVRQHEGWQRKGGT